MMKKIKLTRSWGKRKAGAIVEVDDARAARLLAGKRGAEIKPKQE